MPLRLAALASLVLTGALAIDTTFRERLSRPAAPVLDAMPDMPTDVRGNAITNLTVFMLPHSHDDTGWQRTVDQYYVEQVRYIYDSVVSELRKDSRRKFIFVETAYFMRWWREQSEEVRAATKQLHKNGQIEWVNGGWCMADDASPSTDGQVDQNTLGHRYIQDIFGVQPKYAWHIDPFGLSSSYALWFKQMNYSGWVFNRVDTRLKDLWHNDTHLQFQWKPAGSGANDGIFAHVLDTHYGAPELTYKGFHFHFEWEVFGGLGGGSAEGSQVPVSTTRPLQGDGNAGSPFYNATAPATPNPACALSSTAHPWTSTSGGECVPEAFVAMARLRASFYKLGAPYQNLPPGHAAILVPFGDDMKFQNALKQYSNMDALMEIINTNKDYGVNVVYGTIGDYMKVINQEAFTDSYDGDFMPLATNGNVYSDQVVGSAASVNAASGYWTGHYTTRPLMKGLVARADGAKHTAEIAASLSCAAAFGKQQKHNSSNSLCGKEPDVDMMIAREVTSVLQHHDNIPGTSAPDAAVNLDVRLRGSLVSSDAVMRKAAGVPAAAAAATTVWTDDFSGVSRLLTKVGQAIVLFNPTAATRQEFVEFEIVHSGDDSGDSRDGSDDYDSDYGGGDIMSLAVHDLLTGEAVDSVIIPPVPQPAGAAGAAKDGFVHRPTIIINATIPPLSYTAYSTTAADVSSSHASVAKWSCGMVGSISSDVSIGNKDASGVSVTFSASTGRMASATAGGATFQLTQQFASYHATSGSDAYQFHPDRSKFPFGEPLRVSPAAISKGGSSSAIPTSFSKQNGTRMQLCSIKTPLVERVSQIYLSGPPPPPPPPPPPHPQDGIDCSTEEKCKKTCPHMSTCSDGVYYCCGTHGEHMEQCSGVHACSSNPGLHDCACNANPNSNGLPAGTVLVAESVSVYAGAAGVETKSEFTMRTMDRELVTRYTTDLDNTIKEAYWPEAGSGTVSGSLPVFETDSNGMLMMRRVTNKTHWGKNESYFHVSAAVAGNYYPLASPGAIRIKGSSSTSDGGSASSFSAASGGGGGGGDDGRAFAIVTDRAHGASSLKKGWLEVMLGRRVAETGGISVNDQDHLTQLNWLFPGSSAAKVAEQQRLQQNRVAAPLAYLELSVADAAALIAAQPAPPTGALPPNLHLQSLDRVGLEYTPSNEAGKVLLRIRHVFQEGEGALAAPARADLTTLLPQGLKIANVVELPLNGVGEGTPVPDATKLSLMSLQTRTFEVELTS